MNKTDSILPPPPLHKHTPPPPLHFLIKNAFFDNLFFSIYVPIHFLKKLMRGTLEWNEKGIKWLFDLLLRMVYVQGFGL